MCTVVFLRRPGHAWPMLIAANRDEMGDRPWRPPGRHWPDRPEVVAGIDELAGGTWLGINDYGVVAGILNRPGTLGPAAGLRSRGELPLEALDHADAASAAVALQALDAEAWRPFNMFVADNRDAFWLRSLGDQSDGRVQARVVPPGLSMLTAHDLNDTESARIRFYLPRFKAAAVPDPAKGDWSAWEALLVSREAESGAGDHGAMNIATPSGFGTTSSSLIALPFTTVQSPRKPVWRFGAGHPDSVQFSDVRL
ncbi:MAG TPA: NRDE family protein [Alphaproteobacteria bacterium]|nr:NRDE family protein [Alphaproteobacteria bacterium]